MLLSLQPDERDAILDFIQDNWHSTLDRLTPQDITAPWVSNTVRPLIQVVFKDLNMHVRKICPHEYRKTHCVAFCHWPPLPQFYPRNEMLPGVLLQTAVRTHDKVTTSQLSCCVAFLFADIHYCVSQIFTPFTIDLRYIFGALVIENVLSHIFFARHNMFSNMSRKSVKILTWSYYHEKMKLYKYFWEINLVKTAD